MDEKFTRFTSNLRMQTAAAARFSAGHVASARESVLNHRLPAPPVSARLASPIVRVLDQLCLTSALLVMLFSAYLRHHVGTLGAFLELRVSLKNLIFEAIFLLLWRAMFWTMGLYQLRLIRGVGSFLWRVPLTVIPCTAMLLPALAWHNTDRQLVRSCVIFWIAGTTLMLLLRAAVLTYEGLIRPLLRRHRSVIICGTGLRAKAIVLKLATNPDFRYQLLGFVDSDPQAECAGLAPVLGTVDGLETLLMRLPVDEVIIALPVRSQFTAIEQIVATCGRAGIQTQYTLDLFTTDIAKHSSISDSEGHRVVLQMVNQDHRLYLKAVVDFTVAAIGLVVLSPLLLVVALLVKLTSPGPVFFVQQRFGLNKRKFGMIKFRSMVVDAEARQAALEHLNEIDGPTFKIKNDPRITAIGKIIRRTSIDELPQLINVLKGDMSLVGPRPLPNRDVERFSEGWLMRRFSVKPGITGLWQVSGRSNTDFDHAIKLDLRYIDKWSLALDSRILLRTVVAVVRGGGAY